MNQSVWDRILYQADGEKRPIITIIIVVLNVAVWCVLEFFGDTLDGAYIVQFGGLYPEFIIYRGEWYRLFTAMFLHFGIQHLANNMVLLAAAGSKLERSVGWWKYLAIYLGSGLAGNLLSYFVMRYSGDYAVGAGASGAVFGIIGALLWAAVRSHGRFEGFTAKGLLFMAALCLYNGITTTGIDNWAHFGGLAGGFILSILLL